MFLKRGKQTTFVLAQRGTQAHRHTAHSTQHTVVFSSLSSHQSPAARTEQPVGRWSHAPDITVLRCRFTGAAPYTRAAWSIHVACVLPARLASVHTATNMTLLPPATAASPRSILAVCRRKKQERRGRKETLTNVSIRYSPPFYTPP